MMLRKLVAPIAAAAMLCMLASSASAGFLLPLDSNLKMTLGALPPLQFKGTYQYGGWATLSNNGTFHDMTDTPSIWNDSNIAAGTALLTGVALITNLSLTAANNAGSFTASFAAPNPVGGALTGTATTPYSATLCAFGCLGGSQGLTGQTIVWVAGNPFPLGLSVVGVGGQTALPVPGGTISVTGGPWITGKVRITKITTNVLSMPNRGGGVQGIGVTLEPNGTEQIRTFTTGNAFRTSNPTNPLSTRATVSLAGTNQLTSASAGGQVTLITPLRINTGPLGVGNIPGRYSSTFVFVPEPGTVLLLVSGAAGLIFIGRKRMKG